MFKLAAFERLKSLSGDENVKCSVKYQVLSNETAMVGVIKQKDKATGEIKTFTVEAGRKVIVDHHVEFSGCRPRIKIGLQSH